MNLLAPRQRNRAQESRHYSSVACSSIAIKRDDATSAVAASSEAKGRVSNALVITCVVIGVMCVHRDNADTIADLRPRIFVLVAVATRYRKNGIRGQYDSSAGPAEASAMLRMKELYRVCPIHTLKSPNHYFGSLYKSSTQVW